MPKRPRTVTATELAELLDLTPQRVNQLVKEHGLPKSARGRFPEIECIRWYVNYLREQIRPRNEASEAHEAARTRRMDALARKAEMEAAALEGSLMPIELHRDRISRLVDSWNATLKGLPSRWPPEFPEVKTRQAQQRLRRLVNELLNELAGSHTNGTKPKPRKSERRRTTRKSRRRS
jgi:phage terminase Nu1 subunit (DNA packaging protein)